MKLSLQKQNLCKISGKLFIVINQKCSLLCRFFIKMNKISFSVILRNQWAEKNIRIWLPINRCHSILKFLSHLAAFSHSESYRYFQPVCWYSSLLGICKNGFLFKTIFTWEFSLPDQFSCWHQFITLATFLQCTKV